MFFPILQDGIAEGTNDLIWRLACMICEIIERGMMKRLSIVDVERAIQVVFGNIV